jgi:hypothetical protein
MFLCFSVLKENICSKIIFRRNGPWGPTTKSLLKNIKTISWTLAMLYFDVSISVD